jgi:RNA methyltransferase, TrmH family
LFTLWPIFVFMDETKIVTSLQNPLVRKVLSLRVKSRERRATGLFVLEGERELLMAVRGGYAIETFIFCPDILHGRDIGPVRKSLHAGTSSLEVSGEVYSKMAYRGNTQGIMAIARCRDHSLESLPSFSDNPLILVAEAPEKPGNIGALLRTADAAALDAVLIANPKTDLYNPNTIRSSVGGLFTTHVATGTTAEVIAYLREKNCRLFCAALTASQPYTEVDFCGPSAIVVGTESDGLSDDWLNAATQNILIPMEGQIDSMNVSVSAAILIFEARRQRRLAQ